MFRIPRKSAVFRMAVFAVLVLATATGCAIHNNKSVEVDALTPDGSTVNISYSDTLVDYGYDTTHEYFVDGKQAFCADASQNVTSGTSHAISYEGRKADLIKYAIFLYDTYSSGNAFHNLAESARYAVYGRRWNSAYYAWAHFVVQTIYTDLDADDIDADDKGRVRDAISDLEVYMDNNDPTWLMAKNYKVYKADAPGSGLQDMVWIERYPLGELTVNKTDSQTGTCTTQDNTTFNGTTFTLINKTGYSFVNRQGDVVANNGEVESLTLANGACSVTFTNLPYGNYQIKETRAGAGYGQNTTINNVTINENTTSVTTSFSNTAIRGDVKFVKMDKDNNKPMANALFSISALDDNMNVTETHLVVSNANGVVDTSSSFALHSNHTNGYDNIYDENSNVQFLGYGVWFGYDTAGNHLPVNDNLGALPYGKYLIEELKCDASEFCYKIVNQKKTITIDSANQVVDLGTWNNDCAIFDIGTKAVDGDDGDHYVEADENVKIVDHVHYCARTNTTFTIKGVLINRETGEPLLINGQKVESSVEVTPKEECEDVDMEFVFDGTGYGGQEVVVFERLYYNDEMIVSHEDLNDDFQTVEMVYIHTTATDADTEEKVLPVGKDVTVKDVVDYCLIPGVEYTLKGIIMDKNTGNGLLVNSAPVEAETTFTPTEKCGSVEMFFNLNTTGLGGKKLVVFESLYRGEELINEHKDLDDVDQSIEVEVTPPDTGMFTNSDGSSMTAGSIVLTAGAVVIVSLGGYSVMRHNSRKKFFQR